MPSTKKPVQKSIIEEAMDEINKPEAVVDILAKQTQTIKMLVKDIKELKLSYDALVSYINETVEGYDNRILSIDNVAYLSFYLHGGKQAELKQQEVVETYNALSASLQNMATYREELEAAKEKAHEKELKAAEKKAKVKAARDKKKGKTEDDAGTNS